MPSPWLVLIESNTSGTGRLFARAAAQQGYRPILLASAPSHYSYAIEDGLEVLHIDTTDEEAMFFACQRLAAAEGLIGVTSSSEYYIATAAALAHRLVLPGPSPLAIRVCRDKQTQREQLQAAGIWVPTFCAVTSATTAAAAAISMGFPVVVKPVCGTGSAGVKLCRRADEVAAHADALLQQHHNERGLPVPHRILVEELVEGSEYSVETVGRKIIGITQKYLGVLPYFVEVGHDFPAELPARTSAVIHQAVLQTLEALSLGWGLTHTELRLTAEGPKIIEVNPRLAGGYIPELVRLACGVDLITEAIRLVAGYEPRLERTAGRYASLRFLLPPCDGTLVGVEGLDAAMRIPGIDEVRLYIHTADRVYRRGDFRDRIGHVIASGGTSLVARAAAELAHNAIRLHIQPSTTIPMEEY